MKDKTDKKVRKIPFITKLYISESIEICNELKKYHKGEINVKELEQNVGQIRAGLTT